MKQLILTMAMCAVAMFNLSAQVHQWPPHVPNQEPEEITTMWFTGFGLDTTKINRVKPVFGSGIPSPESIPIFLLEASTCDSVYTFHDMIQYGHDRAGYEYPFRFIWVDDTELGNMAYLYCRISPGTTEMVHYYLPVEVQEIPELEAVYFELYSPFHKTNLYIFSYPDEFEIHYDIPLSGMSQWILFRTPRIVHKDVEAARQ